LGAGLQQLGLAAGTQQLGAGAAQDGAQLASLSNRFNRPASAVPVPTQHANRAAITVIHFITGLSSKTFSLERESLRVSFGVFTRHSTRGVGLLTLIL
jgi:hypothetical protein